MRLDFGVVLWEDAVVKGSFLFPKGEKKEKDAKVDCQVRQIPSQIKPFTPFSERDVDIVNDNTESDAVDEIADSAKQEEHHGAADVEADRGKVAEGSETEQDERGGGCYEELCKTGHSSQNAKTRIGVSVVCSADCEIWSKVEN